MSGDLKLATKTPDRTILPRRSLQEAFAMTQRHRRKQTVPLDKRLQRVADESRQAAKRLPEGPQRDLLLKKAGQAETAVCIIGWLASPGLR
jgi:hypothetical protein